MILGHVNVDRPAGYESGCGAVATLHAYGPRGGTIGTVYVDQANAQEIVNRLGALAGAYSAPLHVVMGVNDDSSPWALICATREAASAICAADPDAIVVMQSSVMTKDEVETELAKLRAIDAAIDGPEIER